MIEAFVQTEFDEENNLGRLQFTN